jgi:phosphoribosylaminoimidazole-succinocarboxamide synthase
MPLLSSDLHLPGQTSAYHGKVRDMYSLDDGRIVAVVSDRISAFDVVLPRGIPFKGQVLNGVATHFLEAVRDIVPVWLEAVPHPNAAVGLQCTPIRLEMVIRGYLTGHAWRTYAAGVRSLCGVALPEGMREHDRFETPIITPATKAEAGHDEDISREDILARGIVPEATYAELERITHALFARGTAMAAERGLLLVDTKYEFGLRDGVIYLIDEVHTPDSSRYFIAEGYAARQTAGQPQEQLSKEFVREWLMERGFMGRPGDVMPEMDDAFVHTVSSRYIDLYERVTGKSFVGVPIDSDTPVAEAVSHYLAAHAVRAHA